MRSGKILLGILAGAAAGVLTGILFSPAKGSKTRKRILKKGVTYSNVLKEKLNKFLEVTITKVNKVMDDAFFDDKKNVHHEEEVLQDSQII